MNSILLAFPMALIISVAFLGNILVCVAIRTDRGLRKTANLFLASLAIADLFVSSFVMTFAAINDLGYWCFSSTLCDTWFAFDVMCSTSSILNLCAISLDRYVHIRDPLRYERLVTKKVAISFILLIWFLSAMISFIPIYYGLHRPDQLLTRFDNGSKQYCVINLSPTFAVLSSCVSFYVPCIIMIGIYCQLYIYARKHVRNIRAISVPLAGRNNEAQSSVSGLLVNQKRKKRLKSVQITDVQKSSYHISDHKAAITVGVIMGVFLISLRLDTANVHFQVPSDFKIKKVISSATFHNNIGGLITKKSKNSNEEPLKKMNDSKPSDDECFEDDKVEFVSNDNILTETQFKFNSIICKNEQITAV